MQLVVTLRTFRVSKARRSSRFNQFVVPVYFLQTRQAAFRLQKRKGVGRKKPSLISSLRQAAFTPVILITIGLAGMTFFGVQASLSSQLEPAKAFATDLPKTPYVLPRSEPTHLSIASAGIDADIIPVGRDAHGSIELPPVLDWVTGWYKDSPTPGQLGPSIIVGHVDNYNGVSVFWKLRDVQAGEIVEVNRADGRTAKFEITALKQFDQSNFPTAEVYGNIAYAGLRLITCGGAFDQSTGHYTQNTVVYAQLVK